MNRVTMLEFRRNAQGVLKRLARGERFILFHRGRPVARLEPFEAKPEAPDDDPFLTIGSRAKPGARGPTPHPDIDAILYARE